MTHYIAHTCFLFEVDSSLWWRRTSACRLGCWKCDKFWRQDTSERNTKK